MSEINLNTQTTLQRRLWNDFATQQAGTDASPDRENLATPLQDTLQSRQTTHDYEQRILRNDLGFQSHYDARQNHSYTTLQFGQMSQGLYGRGSDSHLQSLSPLTDPTFGVVNSEADNSFMGTSGLVGSFAQSLQGDAQNRQHIANADPVNLVAGFSSSSGQSAITDQTIPQNTTSDVSGTRNSTSALDTTSNSNGSAGKEVSPTTGNHGDGAQTNANEDGDASSDRQATFNSGGGNNTPGGQSNNQNSDTQQHTGAQQGATAGIASGSAGQVIQNDNSNIATVRGIASASGTATGATTQGTGAQSNMSLLSGQHSTTNATSKIGSTGTDKGNGAGHTTTNVSGTNKTSIVRGVLSLTRLSGGTVNIKLMPDTIGNVRIQMTMHRGTASIRFYAESAEGRAVIQNSMSSLKTSLETQGIKVEQMTVQSMNRSDATGASGQSGSGDSGSQPQDAQQANRDHDAAEKERKGKNNHRANSDADQNDNSKEADTTFARQWNASTSDHILNE